MSGSLIGGIVGAGIGLIVSGGNPMGALYGWSAGSVAGGLLFPQHVEGPRLTDLKPQSSEYGRPIPIVYGTVALGGNVIWASDYIKEQGQSGGKGGGPVVDTEAYFANFAVAFAEGECTFGRMWAGPEKRLIWDGAKLEGGGKVRFYTGSEDQLPDPLIESYLGVGNVPAFRGTCYVVFEHFPLEKDGNTLPFITAEVGATSGGSCPAPKSSVVVGGQTYSIYDPAPVKIADVPEAVSQYGRVFSDPITGWIYYTYANEEGYWYLERVNPNGGNLPSRIGLGTGTYKMAWNNLGAVRIVESGGTTAIDVDVGSWTFTRSTALHGTVCTAGETLCAVVEVPVADVVWSEFEYETPEGKIVKKEFRYLSYNNSVNGSSAGVPAIEDVDTVTHRFDNLQPPVTWGSTGARSDGDLTPMWGDIGAAHFLTQNSNYADRPNVYWDAYDTKRKILVDFTAGLYNATRGDGFVSSSDFALPDVGEGQAVYSPDQDMFYVVDGTQIRAYDPDKLTPDHWPPEDCVLFNGSVLQAYENGEPIPVNVSMRLIVLPNDPDWLGVVTGAGEIMKIFIGEKGKTTQNGEVLGDIVRDLHKRAGLTTGQIDASQLTDVVDGYTIARQTTVRNAIDALRPAYPFDATESGGLIKYVKRGGASVATIDTDDLDARGEGQASGDPLLTTRQMEVELPRVVNVNYMLAATDYSPATKLAKRLVGASGNETTLDLPLVLTDAKAQEIADVNLQVSWIQRLTYAFSLPRRYSDLEPTDHIVIKGNGMRLTKVTRAPSGVLKCEAVADGSTFYTSNSLTIETPPNDQTVYTPGTTTLELM